MTRRRVLIVEDNQDAGEMYRMLIELAGHEVLLAENGAMGLELFKSTHPDIALVDIGLPGMDGIRDCSPAQGRTEWCGRLSRGAHRLRFSVRS